MQDVAHTPQDCGGEGRKFYGNDKTLYVRLAKVTSRGITFMPWDSDLAMNRDIVILCGEGCAASLLSRSLGDWKRPALATSATEPVSVTKAVSVAAPVRVNEEEHEFAAA